MPKQRSHWHAASPNTTPAALPCVSIDKVLAGSKLHAWIEEVTPLCRERALALTNLEQAAMWAIRAVIFSDPETVVEE